MSTLTRPVYFGAKDRPLFGCLHAPAGPWSGTRVVVCAPIGYEGQFAYLTLRALASHLVESIGAAVLRFDYEGCGDSSGSDEDPLLVPRWQGSIGSAIDAMQALAPSDGPIVLVGLRAGALLAATVAAGRKDVAALVLWAPCASGRLFLREQRAFSAMAHVTATKAGNEKERWGEKGFEANGYVFTDETIAGLEALDLKSIAASPAAQVLVLDRTDLPSKRPFVETWRSSAQKVELELAPGYTEMMEPPWLSKRPTAAITRIAAFLAGVSPHAQRPALPATPVEAGVEISPGITESAAWYDDQQTRFSVLTEPTALGRAPVLILVNDSFGYRIGPNRMHVAAARQLAKAGIATLRIDLAGIGETHRRTGAQPKPPYDLDAIDDIRLAIEYLRRRGRERVAIAGTCASAFLAWHAAVEVGGVAQVVLVNPQTFVPIDYDEARYRQGWQEQMTFRERVRKEPRLGAKLNLVRRRAERIARVGLHHLGARLPSPLFPASLPSKIRSLGSRRARTTLIFSSDDLGLREVRRQLGSKMRDYEAEGFLSMVYIDGPDHAFTPRWANRALIAAIEKEVAAWLPERPRAGV